MPKFRETYEIIVEHNDSLQMSNGDEKIKTFILLGMAVKLDQAPAGMKVESRRTRLERLP